MSADPVRLQYDLRLEYARFLEASHGTVLNTFILDLALALALTASLSQTPSQLSPSRCRPDGAIDQVGHVIRGVTSHEERTMVAGWERCLYSLEIQQL